MVSQRAYDEASRHDGERFITLIEAIGRITEASIGLEHATNTMILRSLECPEANPLNEMQEAHA